eukprot:7011996-Heterocapsa_arctica.AAC.1
MRRVKSGTVRTVLWGRALRAKEIHLTMTPSILLRRTTTAFYDVVIATGAPDAANGVQSFIVFAPRS